MAKTDFNTKLKKISDRVTLNKSRHLLVETELKKYKNLIEVILEAKIILKKII